MQVFLCQTSFHDTKQNKNFKMKMSNLPMAAHFHKEKVFLIGIAFHRNVKILGSFHVYYYNTWDVKCLAIFVKILKNFHSHTIIIFLLFVKSFTSYRHVSRYTFVISTIFQYISHQNFIRIFWRSSMHAGTFNCYNPLTTSPIPFLPSPKYLL